MFRRLLLLTTMLFLAVCVQAQTASAGSTTEFIPQQTLLDYLAGKTDITLIDARSAEEYAAGHIFGAVSVPFDSDLEQGGALPSDLDKPIVVYCKSGKRATALQASMLARGYSNVRVLGPAQMLWADELPVFNCGAADSGPAQLTTTNQVPLAGG